VEKKLYSLKARYASLSARSYGSPFSPMLDERKLTELLLQMCGQGNTSIIFFFHSKLLIVFINGFQYRLIGDINDFFNSFNVL
jgi:hypothetical protein